MNGIPGNREHCQVSSFTHDDMDNKGNHWDNGIAIDIKRTNNADPAYTK